MSLELRLVRSVPWKVERQLHHLVAEGAISINDEECRGQRELPRPDRADLLGQCVAKVQCPYDCKSN